MLGFVTNSLALILGYAYPAFECYKTVEKNRVEIEELRFWCQYWIIVAVLRIFESVGDIFMSWLPMYSEAKLALFIYLWYPKTKGTGYIYNTFLKPYVSKHETDIDRSLLELKARAWDLAIYYWRNCTESGQAKFFQILQFIASSSKSVKVPTTSEKKDESETNHSDAVVPPPPSPPSTPSGLFKRNKQPLDSRRRPPIPPAPPSSAMNRSVLHHISKSESGQLHVAEDAPFLNSDSAEPCSDNTLHAARAKLRRSIKGIS